MKETKSTFSIKPFLILFVLALFSCLCIPSTQGSLKDPLYLAILSGALILFFTVCGKRILAYIKANPFLETNKLREPFVYYLIMLPGFFVKFCYILYTQVWDRQHDVVDFNVGEGQAAYIEYFLTNRHLPDFDPRSVWGFFQPPLHHILSAIWMKISLFLGLAERQAQENIQALTFFYMGALMILTYYICRELNLQRRGTCIVLWIVSLHPAFILLSGSINNDALSLVLTVFSLYLAIVWFKNPRILTIVLLALAIGLAMFAKLSGGMIAPAVAALFLIKLIREKGSRLRLVLQYVVFGVICVPIGLFYTVRNILLFDVPVNYIPEVGQQFPELPFWTRFFDFHMDSVFPAMLEHGDTYYEHNVFLALLKTSLFGEYNYANMWRGFAIPAVFLFLASAVLMLIAFFVTIRLICFKDSPLATEWRWFFGILYATLLFSYFNFALSYSNFSAQDFRYIALTIVVEALLLGIFTDHTDLRNPRHKQLLGVIKGATAIFCICSFITYFMLGFFKP